MHFFERIFGPFPTHSHTHSEKRTEKNNNFWMIRVSNPNRWIRQRNQFSETFVIEKRHYHNRIAMFMFVREFVFLFVSKFLFFSSIHQNVIFDFCRPMHKFKRIFVAIFRSKYQIFRSMYIQMCQRNQK